MSGGPGAGVSARLVVLVALLLGSTAAGCRHLRYEPVGFQVQSAPEESATYLAAALRRQLHRGSLRSLSWVSGKGTAEVTPDDLGQLPFPALYAAWIGSGAWARGSELDLLIPWEERVVPVTVWHGLDRELVVATGSHLPAAGEAPQHGDLVRWGEELAREYAVGGFDHGGPGWTPEEMSDVAEALERLTPSERAALHGVWFGRARWSPRAPRRELARYDPRAEPARIDFYDLGYDLPSCGFVGSVDAPVRATVMTALHEFGHALADWPLRQVYYSYLAAHDAWLTAETPDEAARLHEQVRETWRSYRRLRRRGPVIEAYRRVRGSRPGPTTYGLRRIHESFAEAFALAHLDPDALWRVHPEVYTWFSEGRHLDWAEQALEPTDRRATGQARRAR